MVEDGEGRRGRHTLPDDYVVPSTAVEDAEADQAEAEDTVAADTAADEAGAGESEPGDSEADESGAGDTDADTQQTASPLAGTAKTGLSRLDSRDRVVLVIGLIVVVVIAALGGWVDYRAYQAHKSQPQRELFLQAGKRGAQNLTSIDYNQADADVKRVLDSATGKFYDDFNRRAPSFTDVVKQVKSKSTGTVTAAGVESVEGDSAKVLVAVTVSTEVADGPQQPVRAFRMRLTVQKVGGDAKVSNVEFVQ